MQNLVLVGPNKIEQSSERALWEGRLKSHEWTIYLWLRMLLGCCWEMVTAKPSMEATTSRVCLRSRFADFFWGARPSLHNQKENLHGFYSIIDANRKDDS